MNTNEYMDLAKKCLGIDSDYALAKHLEIRSSTISNYRSGKSKMDDVIALKIANIVGKNPAFVLADSHAERATNPEIRAIWRAAADKMSSGFNSLISCALPRRALRSA
ncbi:MAG: helix-turn-helix domain-containing protein [Aquirhabdus sp.]